MSATRDEAITPYGDNFTIILLTVDRPLHSVDNPYCYAPSCPCHRDRANILAAKQAAKDSLLTPHEALNYIQGKHI